MKPKAISLREAAERVGVSYQTARRKMAAGTFPVPALPRYGRGWKFSESDIDRFLHGASTADAQPRRKPAA